MLQNPFGTKERTSILSCRENHACDRAAHQSLPLHKGALGAPLPAHNTKILRMTSSCGGSTVLQTPRLSRALPFLSERAYSCFFRKVRYPSSIRLAATASTVFLRCLAFFPLVMRMLCASMVVRRSSQSVTGREVASRSISAKPSAFSARGPLVPSILSG